MNIELNQIIEYFQSFCRYFGFQLELLPGAMENQLFLFSLGMFLLAFVSFWCVINIIIYTIVIYLSDNKKVIELVSKNKITLKIFNFYKNTRKLYLLIEFFILTFGTCNMLLITWKVISVFISITWL